MCRIISCYWNISGVGWWLHYKLVSVGFLVLLSLWRHLNKSTFGDISFCSVFLLRPAQLLLESRHSHNLSWLILARRWLLRWRWNLFREGVNTTAWPRDGQKSGHWKKQMKVWSKGNLAEQRKPSSKHWTQGPGPRSSAKMYMTLGKSQFFRSATSCVLVYYTKWCDITMSQTNDILPLRELNVS